MLQGRNRTEGFRIVVVACTLGLALSAISFSAHTQAKENFHNLIQREFEKYDPDYQVHREHYGKRLEEMSAAIANAQAEGRNLHCSQQIFLEAKWLHRYTAHWDRMEDKLKRIELSLDEHDQSYAAEQSPVDGFWGVCYEKWFMRLGATLSALESLSLRSEQPRYSLRSAGRFDTGKKLLTRLQDLLVSDIANTGVNNRAELGSLITTFSQGFFKPHLREILVTSFDQSRTSSVFDSLTEAFLFFLNGAQNGSTGYWGAWYIVDGKVHKSRDLSMTYHIIAYKRGRVEHWPEILETTAAIESEPYPYGWRHNGQYNNHNLYDVAKMYKFGWPHMSETEQTNVRAQIESMIEWSLANTVGPDYTFKHDPTFSDSLADEYYFGISFFDVVGYWQPKRRFWTDAPLDEDAAAMCCRLKHRVKELAFEGWAADGAMSKLERNCGRC
jgi:phosphoribosylformylglycinamidine (FGAM) synthase PurS component